MPGDARSVAILHKNVVVLWAPSGHQRKGPRHKTPASKIMLEIGDLAGHRVGVIGRSLANVTLLRVILKESGIAPDKVTIVQCWSRADQSDGA